MNGWYFIGGAGGFFLFVVMVWGIAHAYYMRLALRLQDRMGGLLDRAEMEYLRLVDQEPDAKHMKETYVRGFKACMREMDALLTRVW